MRILAILLLIGIVPFVASLGAQDKDTKAEKAEKIIQQKKAGQANWDAVEAGPVVVHETKNLILLAAPPMERRLKDIGATLEKGYDQAKNVLAFEKDQELYPGKITVYLFPTSNQLRAFVRRVERRRVDGEEVGSHSIADEAVHAAASPGKTSGDLSLEGQAVAQVAAVLLGRRAGVRVPVADWLVEGFGRATWYRISPRDKVTLDDRRAASRLSTKRTAKEIYDGSVEAIEATPLRGSLADYLAYGGFSSKFPALLKGYELGENVENRTTDQALEAAGITWDRIAKGWKTWALNPR